MTTRPRSDARFTRSAAGAPRLNQPRVKLVELREYVSERTGRNYFSGFIGAAKVVMLRDSRADCTGKEIARWQLFVEQAPERPRAAAVASQEGEVETTPSPPAKSVRKARPRSNVDLAVAGMRSRGPASDKRAREVLRSYGLDAKEPIKDDELPPW